MTRRLRTSSVHLARCGTVPDPELDWISTRLHSDVREKLLAYRTVERRNQTVLGRVLLAIALRELGVQLDVLSELGIRPTGEPDVPTGYSGSISHTDGLVGAVAAEGAAIGFDLEHCWHSFLEPEPLDPDVLRDGFFRDQSLRGWVGSEAVAKASGATLSDVLVTPLVGGRMLLGKPWFVQTLTVDDGFMAGIATLEPISEPSVVWLARDPFCRSLHLCLPELG